MRLIIGLGNPGSQYENTRHNAGFFAVDHLAEHFLFEPFKKADKHKAIVAEGMIEGQKVILAKPQTFMNLSGESVQSLAQFYKIPFEEVMVIYDDVALPFGSFRIRPSGSAGGHNGIKSIIQQLGTEDFIRIRLGIEPNPPFPGELEDYVLGRVSEKHMVQLQPVIESLPEVAAVILKEGVKEGMNRFNEKID
jgi:peptidyl-tRNA hydrolase, PTH1 family